ncbi:MAG TPA: CbtA family protein [Stellaceae bacterium]|nr:CbtA family protein [Stellaceae bacterium]
MTRRIFATGLIAGLLAGLVLSALHWARIDPLIARAEVYESAAVEPAHSAHAQAWEPEGWQRPALTFLANLVIATGFGLMLSGAFAVRQTASGKAPDAREGLLWGIGGFAAFALAPAVGLPPVPPGMAGAAILARQGWWLATAIATASGLLLLVFPRGWAWRVAGAGLILAPHVVGAPEPPPGGDAVPAAIAAQFTTLSLAAAALFWLTLGGIGGWLYARLEPEA